MHLNRFVGSRGGKRTTSQVDKFDSHMQQYTDSTISLCDWFSFVSFCAFNIYAMYTYTCRYIHTCMRTYIRTHIHTYRQTDLHTYIHHTCVCIYIYIYTFLCLPACLPTLPTYKPLQAYLSVYLSVYLSMYLSISFCIYIYTCVYMHIENIYTFTQACKYVFCTHTCLLACT